MFFVRLVLLTLSCFGMFIHPSQATHIVSKTEANNELQTHFLFTHQNLLRQPQLKLSENALNKQKQNLNTQISEHDDLILLNTIHAAPTQNFFAAQQQRFSRFVQNLLALCNS
ncbi:hypothetical protein [Acinetobacter boissieri]|uniref:DUF4179 domain-containing protein n=1 Tax=Acinetobacter boissieri TaxID=1219383 RepID=A0A1G6GI85_9GAMM|nr:hypothetical protein [Acinetobacter boissieri]SDB81660.1 hypothetical protein SAMN05421733_101188 [Acinetobacter boissieri]